MPRKSSFKPEYIDQVVKLCRLGAKDPELASFFGVSDATIDNWKKKEPLFLGAIKEGKIVSDAEVNTSLYKRALGWEWDEEVPTKVKTIEYNENGKKVLETEQVIVTTVHRVLPPDPTSMIFWHKNRRKDEWRDRQEVTGVDGGPIETATITYMPKQLPDDYYNQSTAPAG